MSQSFREWLCADLREGIKADLAAMEERLNAKIDTATTEIINKVGGDPQAIETIRRLREELANATAALKASVDKSG